MDEVFRIIMLRPDALPEGFEVDVLRPGTFGAVASRSAARRLATEYCRLGLGVRSVDELGLGRVAVSVHDLTASGPCARRDVARLVTELTGSDLAVVAADPAVDDDVRWASDTLVATRLTGWADGTDTSGLAAAAQGYDVIVRAALGQDPVGLRPLAIPGFADPEPSYAGSGHGASATGREAS